MINKKAVIRDFSRYACQYDKYADIQKLAAFKLLGKIKENSFSRILEIGCGTGNYTALLRTKFINNRLTAVDICEKMIEVAKEKLQGKKINFIVADAENISLSERFDLITSNACFQWFDNLDKALMNYSNMLNKKGAVLFSVFGPVTFCELNAALNSIFNDKNIHANGFLTKEKLELILNKNLMNITITEIVYKETFSSLRDLLIKIKYSGVRGKGLGNGIALDRRVLNRLEECYLDKFKQIRATYQIFLCKGQKSG